MIVYTEAKETKAIYFDNEGHVIHYTPSFSDDGKSLTFLSAIQPSSPRFRLTYIKDGDDRVKINFEIAPPGRPEAFKMYLQGTCRRK
jgi:hypothetical protein